MAAMATFARAFVCSFFILVLLENVDAGCSNGIATDVDNHTLFGSVALDAAFQAAIDSGCTGSSSPDVVRINSTRLGDVVKVSGPDAIRAFELDPGFDRPAGIEAPKWFANDIRASRAFCSGDRWFSGFISWFRADWNERTLFHVRNIHGNDHSDEEAELAATIMGMEPEGRRAPLIDFCVRLVGRLFLSDVSLPPEVVVGAASTVQDIPVSEEDRAVGAQAQETVLKFVGEHVGELNECDVAHNLGASLGLAAALARLSNGGGVLGALFNQPVIPFTFRVAVAETAVNGLLDTPVEPGKTLVLLYIGDAAMKTENDTFLFGAGTERQCPFKEFYKRFGADVERRFVRMQSHDQKHEL